MTVNLATVATSLVARPSQIIDDVLIVSRDDYDVAIDWYVHKMAAHPGTLFIGQFGSVNTPGVSDIDILVVTADATYKSAWRESRLLAKGAPNGGYLFAHAPSVIPLSLVPAFRLVHTLENLHPLWGEPPSKDLLTPPPFPLAEINAIVWNSAFLRYTVHHRHHRHGLRKLLLMLGNIVQSIAADYRMVGRTDDVPHITRWGKEHARCAVLNASPRTRCEVAHRFLAEGLAKWLEADWEVEAWWSHTVRASNSQRPSPVHVSLDTLTQLRFEREKDDASTVDRHMLGFRRAWRSTCLDNRYSKGLRRVTSPIRAIKWQFKPVQVLTVPRYYLDVFLAIRSAYEPIVNTLFCPEYASQVDELRSSEWIHGLETYKDAVTRIRKHAQATGEEDLSVCGDRIMTPLGV